MNKILCVVGPTGSGKTGYSIELAETLKTIVPNTYIINADSRQVYRDFPLITAQPSDEEKKDIPHKLYGFLNTDEQCNAGLWLERVHKEIENAYAQNALPLLVGGTGMYIKALTEGIAQIPKIPTEISEKILNEMHVFGTEKMYEKLQEIDCTYAQKIHQNDKQRIARALEVYEYTNKNLSEWHKNSHAQSKYISHKIGIGMPLDELTPYLSGRIDTMLSMGALEEAKNAYTHFPDSTLPGWSGIGCQELALYLKSQLSLEETKELWIKNTRAYAKRQWTWFRADKKILWCHPLDKKQRQDSIEACLKFFEK